MINLLIIYQTADVKPKAKHIIFEDSDNEKKKKK